MGLQTVLYEIDPDSAFFALIQADRDAAECVFMLEWRYRSPENFFQVNPTPTKGAHGKNVRTNNHESILLAIETLIKDEPRLTDSYVDLFKSGFGFSGPLSTVAESFNAIDRDFAYATIHGLHPLPSSTTKGALPVSRWIDTERCHQMADWLSKVTETKLKEAYRKPEHWPTRESIARAYEQDHDGVHDVIRQLQKLYEDAASHGNIVVSQTD